MTVVTLVNNVSLSNTLQGLQMVTYIITGTHKTTVYMPFIRDNLNHRAPELGETLTQQTHSLSSNSTQALQTFPPRPPSLPLFHTGTPNLPSQASKSTSGL